MFVDVDYPPLMERKVRMIEDTEALRSLLPSFRKATPAASDNPLQGLGLLADSENYLPIGCDLRNLDLLSKVLEDRLKLNEGPCAVAVLFVAEVSVAYMERSASQSVLEWASRYEDVRFCLLEQHLPDGADHPFAQTMLAHFQKLRTPLNAIGTMGEMRSRFEKAGWPRNGIDLRTLWEVWRDETFVSLGERARLDSIEPFDEWEELALFGSHYFLMIATKREGIYDVVTDNGNETAVPSQSSKDKSTSGPPLFSRALHGPQRNRRFGALIPSSADGSSDSIGLHAGLGTKEREHDCTTHVRYSNKSPIDGPPTRFGIMCHTITRIGNTSDLLFVGGRASPEKASASCWLRQSGEWKQVQDLPEGRYRHCTVPFEAVSNDPAVVVFGGKNSKGQILDSWLIWTAKTGWTPLEVESQVNDPALISARFGAAATSFIDIHGRFEGVMIGGMDTSGQTRGDARRFALNPDGKLKVQGWNIEMESRLEPPAHTLARFGAQLVTWKSKLLLIGGVTADNLLTRETEIIDITSTTKIPLRGPRPMLVGTNILGLDEGLLVLGGGATCFSFGTYWNTSCVLTTNQELETAWHVLAKSELPNTQSQSLLEEGTASNASYPSPVSIQRRHISSQREFEEILQTGKPVILTGHSIGACTAAWTPTYLKDHIGADRAVVVHRSPTQKMDFQTKNFSYRTQSFSSFIDAIEHQGDRLYLRALSMDSPGEKPTTLANDFPSIAQDFRLPDELAYVQDNAHSSPLRISGPVTMWLHYDVMANVLCQIQGRKRLLLFPPSDVTRLGFKAGASSSSIDLFSEDPNHEQELLARYPGLARAQPHEALLEAGDILFIPSLWLHTAAPTGGLSVAVNVFFRNLKSAAYAAGRDVYGNRDLAAYEKGRKDVDRVIKAFDDLPSDVRNFYLSRLGMEMLERAVDA
ncbi:Clavaminate synthase-like protein [Polychaeton citri CBS 116435]|uniref:tRNA wybutosine-synthesizing protein 4 n=1 Tax=Polychaeton citri CBS 116435 TaxID=1314669 RepID=A0A9P4Q2H2_9PEZI|nr:Clavaminate synthase-like protein [Polychaeton citri CBS 116435]